MLNSNGAGHDHGRRGSEEVSNGGGFREPTKRPAGGSHSRGIPRGTTLDFVAICPPCSFGDGSPRALRLEMTVVRLRGSSSNSSRPSASLIVIAALTGHPISNIPKVSCASAERARGSILLAERNRSSLRSRFTTSLLFSLAATASVVQQREISGSSAAPGPRHKRIRHKPANLIDMIRPQEQCQMVCGMLVTSRKVRRTSSCAWPSSTPARPIPAL